MTPLYPSQTSKVSAFERNVLLFSNWQSILHYHRYSSLQIGLKMGSQFPSISIAVSSWHILKTHSVTFSYITLISRLTNDKEAEKFRMRQNYWLHELFRSLPKSAPKEKIKLLPHLKKINL